MELTARLVVLVACAIAAGALFVVLASPAISLWAASSGGRLAPLRGVLPVSLAAFVVIAGGGATTGAGVANLAGVPLPVLDAVESAGTGLLIACGLLAWRRFRRQVVAIAPAALLVFAWAGAALALVSWLAALATAATVVVTGIRVERRE